MLSLHARIPVFILMLSTGVSCEAVDSSMPRDEFLRRYCVECHQGKEPSGGIDFATLQKADLSAGTGVWERAARKINAFQMPPVGADQPQETTRLQFVQRLESELDQHYAKAPAVADTESLRRLTRIEYQNAIRDLLGVEIDASTMLPADESSNGFDNITVSDLSPIYIERAISAAQKISHMAVGAIDRPPSGETYRVRPDITQDVHITGLPPGTRGGTVVKLHVAQAGTYEITIRLSRDRNEEVEGLHEPHELLVLLDRGKVEQFTVKPPPGRKEYSGLDYSQVDKHLKCKVELSAGAHELGVTFLQKSGSLLETKRQPYNAHYNMHRHPRLGPAIYEVSVTGPLTTADESKLDSTIRASTTGRGLFTDLPDGIDPTAAAREQLAPLMRLAYRRELIENDFKNPLATFQEHYTGSNYRAAMEHALTEVLISPNFLLKIERVAPDAKSGEVVALSEYELASRLSFFLWSSIPDRELLDLAKSNRLSQPAVLDAQVERMLRDHRSQSLVENFLEQWLYLRNLESMTPDLRMFPDFDDNLRQAFRQETRLLFDAIMRENRSVLDLIDSDFTFLNERLARHYGIPHIYGSRFRRVEVEDNTQRGGLLRHGSILMVTSYATRTSPVVRGHWILKNIVGSPPPPPPANVPALKENTVDSTLPMRERLAAHRANVACASCHDLLDPIGFSMENYDAVGRWRELEDGLPLDVKGSFADGSPFVGVSGLEKILLKRPELFVGTLTERMMTYAIGRGMMPEDGPAIRAVVKRSSTDGYRFVDIVQGIVSSPVFRMRRVP